MSEVRLDIPETQNSRVFVGNVSSNTDEEELQKHFEKHGAVKGVVVLKGFAFIQFENPEDAYKAIQAENGVEFNGKKIDVKEAKRREDSSTQKNPTQPAGPPPLLALNQPPPAVQSFQEQGQQGQVGQQWHGQGQQGQVGQQWHGQGQQGQVGQQDHWNNSNRGGIVGFRGSDRGGARGGRGGRRGGAQGFGQIQNEMNQGNAHNRYQSGYGRENFGPPQSHFNPSSSGRSNVETADSINDCEIVCVNKGTRQYAESIESRLKNIGLRVDVLFPNPEIPLYRILENIASRGVTFAVVVNPLNEQHRSLTLNVLQGQQQEHRNMPYEDAMAFVAKNFEAVVEGRILNNDFVPEDIRTVLGFLAENRPLSVMEYDKLIKFFCMKREAVLKKEYGDNIPPSLAAPPVGRAVDPAFKAKQDVLHERIMTILNKPPPPPKDSSPGASLPAELNASLQKAIDSLIKNGPNLLSQMPKGQSSDVVGQMLPRF